MEYYLLGNIILLTITWLLFRQRRESPFILTGTDPVYRLLQLVAGFVSCAFLAGIVSGIFAATAHFFWEPTAGLGITFLIKGLFTSFNSVLFEELLFRGVLLYFAIRWWSEKRANLVSAICFGIYHWFTLSVFGSPVIMLWVLVYTGLWGLMFAYAFSRTGSIALPLGLHWGWSFVDQYIFGDQRSGLFSAVTTVHTRYLSTIEEMLYLRLPVIAFAVVAIVLLCQYLPLKRKFQKIK